MNRFRFLAVVLVASFALQGCAMLRGLISGGFRKPELRFKTVNLRGISLGGTTLDTVWLLKNPNPVGLSIAHLDYILFIEGKQVVAGMPPRGLQVGPGKQSELTFPAELKFQELFPALAVFLNQDTARYRAEGTIGVNTPVGVIKLPLRKEGTFEVPKVPALSFEAPKIKNLSLTSATLELPLKLTNRNSFPLPIAGLGGRVRIGGAEVGSITAGQMGMLAPGSSQTVRLPLTVDFTRALQAANAIRQGRGKLELVGQLSSGSAQVPVNLGQMVDFRR